MAKKTIKKTEQVDLPLGITQDTDLFSQLAADTKKKNEPVKKERPTINMDTETQANFVSWVKAKAVFDVIEQQLKSFSSILSINCFNKFISSMWQSKSHPENAKLSIISNGKSDLSAIYQVQDRYKLNFPIEDNTKISLKNAFLAAGVSNNTADNIIEQEFNFTPQVKINDIDILKNGSDEEKVIANKLIKFCMTELTADERKLAIKSNDRCEVKKGFLDRVVTYCKTEAELAGVFKITQPVHFPSHGKFAISDTPEARVARLITAASELLDIPTEED